MSRAERQEVRERQPTTLSWMKGAPPPQLEHRERSSASEIALEALDRGAIQSLELLGITRISQFLLGLLLGFYL